jgi:hypothetical protein
VSHWVTIKTQWPDSELDLQIWKLSDKVSLRASIQDANIPLQKAGIHNV